MKILLVCGGLGGGGAERVAVNLANTFVLMDHDVTIFARNQEDAYYLDSSVTVLPSINSGIIRRTINLSFIIMRNNYDAVISFTDTPNIGAFFATSISRREIVYIPTVHSDLAVRDKHVKSTFRFNTIRWLHKLACRSADAVIVVSKEGLNSLVDYYELNRAKARFIYNAVVPDSFRLPSRKIAYAGQDVVHLVSAGRFTKAKNFYMMMDVINLANKTSRKKFLLDIYGKGEDFDAIVLYAKELGVDKYVTFKGFVDNLIDTLSDYDMFILTSDWEGFGNVLVEALCARLPIISTDCRSGPNEILAGGKFGRLVVPGNVEDFVRAMTVELENPLYFEDECLEAHLRQFRQSPVASKFIGIISDVQSAKEKA